VTKTSVCLGERRRRHAQATPDERMRRARATLVKRRRWYAPMIIGERRRRARVTREAASCSRACSVISNPYGLEGIDTDLREF
jgi:hypothetical protein